MLPLSFGEAEFDPFTVHLVFFVDAIDKFLKIGSDFFSHSKLRYINI